MKILEDEASCLGLICGEQCSACKAMRRILIRRLHTDHKSKRTILAANDGHLVNIW